MADYTISLAVTVKDLATPALNQIAATAENIRKGIWAPVGGKQVAYIKATQRATKASQDLTDVQAYITPVMRKQAIAYRQASAAQKGFTGSIFGAIMAFNHYVYALRTVARWVGNVTEAVKEGAVVQQTTESWDRFTESLGQSTELLQELRIASNSTVSDMQLMSDTMLMASGVGDKLATAMLSAAPQLLEVARAAQILNPALGDTSYFYNSLAMGIKRTSKFRLDNLGITIRATEAYGNYARSIGKSVTALTGEEQQMAVLLEVLKVGENLINKVGTAAESAVDPYNQLATAWENATNRWKELAAAIAEPLVKTMAVALTPADIEMGQLIIYNDALEEMLITRRQHIELLGEAAQETGAIVTIQAMRVRYGDIEGLGALQLRDTQELLEWFIDNIDRIRAIQQLELDFMRFLEVPTEVIRSQKELIHNNTLIAAGYTDVRINMKRTGEEGRRVASTFDEAGDAAERSAAQLKELSVVMGGKLGPTAVEFESTQRGLKQRIAEVNEELAVTEAKLSALPRVSGLPEVLRQIEEWEATTAALHPTGWPEEWQKEQRLRELEVEVQPLVKQRDALLAAGGSAKKYEEEILELMRERSDLIRALQLEEQAYQDDISQTVFDIGEAASETVDWKDAVGDLGDLQWAVAEDLGLIDQKTLQVYNTQKKVYELYAAGKIELEEAVDALGIIRDWAAAPEPYGPMADIVTAGIYGVAQWTSGQQADIPPGLAQQLGLINEEFAETFGTEQYPKESYFDIANWLDVEGQGDFLLSLVGAWTGEHRAYFIGHYVQEGEGGGGNGNGGGRQPGSSDPQEFQTGGIIPETGVYLMHQGELVIPQKEVSTATSGDGGGPQYGDTINNFNLNVSTMQETFSVTHEFEVMKALAGR